MLTKPTTFTKLFALWRTDQQLADDMGVPRWRARQWRARDYVSPWYWPKLTELALLNHGRRFTYRQLVEATVERRGPPVPGTNEGAKQSARAA